MGSGFSSTGILINLDRNDPFYFTDETISGVVNWNITADEIQAHEVYITLIGEAGFQVVHVSHGKNGATRHTTYYHIPFYSIKFPFSIPKAGENELILKQGEYSWPFRIPLAKNLPPTILDPQSYPHVRYYLQVVIDRPWYKRNTKETKYITVYPHVSILENPQCLQTAVSESRNRKLVELKCSLKKSGYVPGELIEIALEIKNPQKSFN